MKTKSLWSIVILCIMLLIPAYSEAQGNIRHRLIVLTDIEADPDDSQTLIRLLLYSNQIDIEGLIATTSVHQKTRVAPETIRKIIRGYEKVQPNLLKHEQGFPAARELLSMVKQGLPVYGMEGDTPSWLILIQNGLNNPDHPEWGSWGGRYELYIPEPPAKPINPMMTGGVPVEAETRPIWTNADDKFTPRIHNEYGKAVRQDTGKFTGNHVTLWRWREDFQNDFAARMDWCIKTYEEANHPPVARVNQPEEFTVKSGEIFKLDADGSYDPDGDNLSYLWFQYPEAGTYRGIVNFAPYSENLYNIHTIRAPEVSSPQTIHFILKVTDKGTPVLSRYKRVIVTVIPK